MSKKPLVSSMKPMASSSKPDASLGHQDKPVSSQPGHGMITRRELESMSPKLERKLGEKRGAAVTDALQAEADKHGGVLRERHLDEAIHNLERSHSSDIRSRDIERLKDIAESSL